MIINCIHNELLGPEGGTQLLHHNFWGRIDSTGGVKSMFLSSAQRYISAKKNAENKNATVDQDWNQLMGSVKVENQFNHYAINQNYMRRAIG